MTSYLVGFLVLLKILLHLATSRQYGIFRDELYYLACARHLAFGYVDQPPLIALVAWLVTHLLGTSLFAAEGPNVTIVDLEHSKLERHGKNYEELRTLFYGPGAWGDVLALYAKAAGGSAHEASP